MKSLILLKKVWSDGMKSIQTVLLELMERLMVIIPQLRTHQVLYYGVFLNNAKYQKEIQRMYRRVHGVHQHMWWYSFLIAHTSGPKPQDVRVQQAEQATKTCATNCATKCAIFHAKPDQTSTKEIKPDQSKTCVYPLRSWFCAPQSVILVVAN